MTEDDPTEIADYLVERHGLECAFRTIPTTVSDLTRPPIPIDRDHLFRWIATSVMVVW